MGLNKTIHILPLPLSLTACLFRQAISAARPKRAAKIGNLLLCHVASVWIETVFLALIGFDNPDICQRGCA